MAEPSSGAAAPVPSSGEIHPMQSLLRFLHAVRRRKSVLLVVMAASLGLGGLYYATAPRVYQSKASLLVLQTGSDNWSVEMTGGRTAQDLMGTYKEMLDSEVVLEEALKHLRPEDQIDLARRGAERAGQAAAGPPEGDGGPNDQHHGTHLQVQRTPRRGRRGRRHPDGLPGFHGQAAQEHLQRTSRDSHQGKGHPRAATRREEGGDARSAQPRGRAGDQGGGVRAERGGQTGHQPQRSDDRRAPAEARSPVAACGGRSGRAPGRESCNSTSSPWSTPSAARC